MCPPQSKHEEVDRESLAPNATQDARNGRPSRRGPAQPRKNWGPRVAPVTGRQRDGAQPPAQEEPGPAKLHPSPAVRGTGPSPAQEEPGPATSATRGALVAGHSARPRARTGLEEAPRAYSASTDKHRPGGSAAGIFSVGGRGLAWRERRGHIQRQRTSTGLEEAPRAHSGSTGEDRPGGSAAGTFRVNGRGSAWRKRQRARTGLEEAPRAHSAPTSKDWPGGSAAARTGLEDTFGVNEQGLAWRKRRGRGPTQPTRARNERDSSCTRGRPPEARGPGSARPRPERT